MAITLGLLADWFTVVTTLITLGIWFSLLWRARFDNKQIEIELRVADSNETFLLPARVRRKNLTRSEVFGILGSIPMLPVEGSKQPRFRIEEIGMPAFYRNLQEAQENSRVNRLAIDISESELNRFDRDKLKLMCEAGSN